MFQKRYRKEIELQVDAEECRNAFEKLKSGHSIFNLYSTVKSLRELFKSNNKNYAHKDEVMVIFLTELHRNKAIFPLINIMLWNNLYWLYCRHFKRVTDPEELFNRIQEEFYHCLINHNLERLPKKVNMNILFNTRKKIIAWEEEKLRYEKELKEFDNLSELGLSPFDLAKSQVYPEQMEEYLLDMVYRKIITEIQYDLILETQVYKKMNQKEWALKRGIPHSTVRTLIFRAKVAMRRYEEERKKEKEN